MPLATPVVHSSAPVTGSSPANKHTPVSTGKTPAPGCTSIVITHNRLMWQRKLKREGRQ